MTLQDSVARVLARAVDEGLLMKRKEPKPEPEERYWIDVAVDLIVKVYPPSTNEYEYKRSWKRVLELMAPSGIRAICGEMYAPCRFCGQKALVGEKCPHCNGPA